jgi:hypothetical protein
LMHRILSFHNALDDTQAARMLAREKGARVRRWESPRVPHQGAEGTRQEALVAGYPTPLMAMALEGFKFLVL